MNRNKTVLVISERHDQFSSTASSLRDDGYSVSFETATSTGLSRANAEAPYLIISDLAAPDVDGLQLCRLMRSSPTLNAVPILLVGDLSKDSSIVRDGFLCGAAEYVQKPVSPSHLVVMCRNMLAPGRQRTKKTAWARSA